MSIRLIENPPYTVDFQQFAQTPTKNTSLIRKIQSAVCQVFQWIALIFTTIIRSAYLTLKYSWTSFKLLVIDDLLGSRRDAGEFILILAFKVSFWVTTVFWCFITTVFRLLIERQSSASNFLTELSGGEINIEHLQTKELSIDLSDVPKDITVDQLTALFDEINFSDLAKPGYMAPTSRQEGKITYTVDELKESLKIFISRVKGRKAFIGTPPAYDTPRLVAFYQQIEDAVRFSIHKVIVDLTKFQKTNGTDPSLYTTDQLRQYKNLLETKARVALDLAIAGKYCGARYMGESLSIYFSLKGETSENGTLQDSLIELLAHKRREIAQEQVQTHLGFDTHALSKYMGNLGQPLGLPGTRNVIEHLDQAFDSAHYLTLFFQKYTVDEIIDTVQAKIKQSQLFREKLTDWLKDQANEWKADTANAEELMKKIQPIIDEKMENAPLSPHLQMLQELITHLKEKNIAWPAEEAWNEFLEELLALKETKQWFKMKFPSANPFALQTHKSNLKMACSEETLGQALASQIKEEIIKNGSLPMTVLIEQDIKTQKIEKIRQILPIQKETLERVLNRSVPLKTALQDHFNLKRREEFLAALKLDNIDKQGLSPEIMEWLLVSQKILLPQVGC